MVQLPWWRGYRLCDHEAGGGGYNGKDPFYLIVKNKLQLSEPETPSGNLATRVEVWSKNNVRLAVNSGEKKLFSPQSTHIF